MLLSFVFHLVLSGCKRAFEDQVPNNVEINSDAMNSHCILSPFCWLSAWAGQGQAKGDVGILSLMSEGLAVGGAISSSASSPRALQKTLYWQEGMSRVKPTPDTTMLVRQVQKMRLV